MKAHSPEMIGSRVARNRNKEQRDKHLNGCSEHEFLCISLRIAGRTAGGDESAQHKNGIHNSDGDQILRNFLNGLIIYKRGQLPEPKVIEKEKGLANKKEDKK